MGRNKAQTSSVARPADLGGVFPRHAADISGSRGEPHEAQVFADAPAVARGEQVDQPAEEGSHRVIRPERQVGERAKEEFQLKDGGRLAFAKIDSCAIVG